MNKSNNLTRIKKFLKYNNIRMTYFYLKLKNNFYIKKKYII